MTGRGGQILTEKDILIHMQSCTLCPRACGARRDAGQTGACRAPAEIYAARAALHFWEEPCISGTRGSGAVFFSGCALGCRYCQNAEISGGISGKKLSVDDLAAAFLRLEAEGAHNINLVTAGHYAPQAACAVERAKKDGLSVPVVWNSSGYESPGTLRLLEGLVDIWLPDFKYMDADLAAKYSRAPDYPERAKETLAEMVRQTPEACFDREGIMRRGVIVRHMMLPGHEEDSKRIVRYLFGTYGSRIWISLMSQYTPMPAMADDPLLSQKVTRSEYMRVVRFARELGVVNGFIQEGDTAKESFIPAFDGEGL